MVLYLLPQSLHRFQPTIDLKHVRSADDLWLENTDRRQAIQFEDHLALGFAHDVPSLDPYQANDLWGIVAHV